VHRIGRTGRAGLEGHAFTIAMPEDRAHIEAIEKLIGHPIPPFNVEGLDPIDWAEDDGRRRRGRGRTTRPKAAAREKPPAREKAAREKPVREKPASEKSVREKPAPQPRAAKPKPEALREPLPLPREPQRREPRRRDNDLGPAVTGFGDEMPAFMLLRRRIAQVAAGPSIEEGDSEA
jgi:superfamily II DNA/RNA helicase